MPDTVSDIAAMRDLPSYAAAAADVVHAALRCDFPRTRRLFDVPYQLPEAALPGVTTAPEVQMDVGE